MAITMYEQIRQVVNSKLYLFKKANLDEGVLKALMTYSGKVVLGNHELQEMRDALLTLNESDLTSTEWRAISDILHSTDIGAMSTVKLDGTTTTSIASTIGYGTLTTHAKTSLVDAINEIGDVSTIKLDGTTSSTDIVAAIGTGVLTTAITTSLVDAINSVNEANSNIIVTSSQNFYGCINDEPTNTVVDISRPASNSEPVILTKWIECAKFAVKEPATGYAPERDGGECHPLTSPGDAFAICLGTMMDVTSYTA